jgi:hypothetical protein
VRLDPRSSLAEGQRCGLSRTLVSERVGSTFEFPQWVDSGPSPARAATTRKRRFRAVRGTRLSEPPGFDSMRSYAPEAAAITRYCQPTSPVRATNLTKAICSGVPVLDQGQVAVGCNGKIDRRPGDGVRQRQISDDPRLGGSTADVGFDQRPTANEVLAYVWLNSAANGQWRPFNP